MMWTTQPQSGPAQLDRSNQAVLSFTSALLPIFKTSDMIGGSAAFDRSTGVTITPDKFAFTTTTSVLGYSDAAAAQFRQSTFTKVLCFRLKSLANGYIYTTDSRFNVGIGIENITSGNIGVSWYDGSAFNQISIPAALNVDYTLIAVATPAGMSLYINGALIGTTTSGPIVYAPGSRGATYGAADYFSLTCTLFDLKFSAFSVAAMPAAVATRISANPWQLFKAPQRVMLAAAGGATDTPINPGVGAIALTGYSPSVAQTANQALTPGADSLAITGYAPSVVQSANRAVLPGVGALAVTGYAPVLAQTAHQAVLPGAGTLTVTGYAPAVTQQSTSPSLTPGAGQITITGYAPSVAQSSSQASGGFFEVPHVPRRRSVREERERLGIIPREVKQIVQAVARASVVAEKTDMQAEQQLAARLAQQDIEAKARYTQFMQQERDRILTRDIDRALRIRQRQAEIEEDDRDAEMLLM